MFVIIPPPPKARPIMAICFVNFGGRPQQRTVAIKMRLLIEDQSTRWAMAGGWNLFHYFFILRIFLNFIQFFSVLITRLGNEDGKLRRMGNQRITRNDLKRNQNRLCRIRKNHVLYCNLRTINNYNGCSPQRHL